MKIYTEEDKKNKINGSQLSSILSTTIEMIVKIRYSDLIDVTSEEFINNCNNATKEKH